MANIETLLTKEKQKHVVKLDSDVAVFETQKLLMDKGAEDYQVLRSMGMATIVNQAENKRAAQMEHKMLDEKYGEIYTLEQIKTLACTYALKFLRSDKYKGQIDPVMLQKIKEFGAEAEIKLGSTDYQYKFFILAPAQSFNLIERPKPEPIDPVLFYKIDENHFRKIHKWGTDFSTLRLLKGWKYKSEGNYFLSWALIFATVLVPIAAMIANSWGLGVLIGGILSSFVAGIVLANVHDEKDTPWATHFDNDYKVNP